MCYIKNCVKNGVVKNLNEINFNQFCLKQSRDDFK